MPSSRHAHTASAWWLALLAATLPIVYRQVTVSDAWWHAVLGKWMDEILRLPTSRVFILGLS